MARAKTTARHASCKIIAGSALDRLTEGRSFTEVVHQIAEMYERACGGPVVQEVEPAAPQELPASVTLHMDAPRGAVYAVPDPDPDSDVIHVVGYDEAMRLMKLQCPVGLEPVLDSFMIQAEGGNADGDTYHAEKGDTEFDAVKDAVYGEEPEQVDEEPFEYEQLA